MKEKIRLRTVSSNNDDLKYFITYKEGTRCLKQQGENTYFATSHLICPCWIVRDKPVATTGN
jgi:hypothetical protein